MKARFLALAALVLGLASCQQEFNDVAQLGGEVDFQLKVDAAELGTTRAGDSAEKPQAGRNSAYGAIDYLQGSQTGDDCVDWEDVDLRYSLEVYDYEEGNYKDAVPVKDRMVKIVDAYEPVVFDLRLVPGRNYHFVVFADFVPQGATVESTEGVAFTEHQSTLGIHHTIGDNLRSIKIKADAINDECCDAYFATEDVEVKHQALNVKDIVLKRPYGKLRVIATDLAELNLNVDPAWVEVTYTAKHPQKFNAVTGNVTKFEEGKEYVLSSTYKELYKDVEKGGLANHFYNAGYDNTTTTNADGVERHTHMTLFTDYILGSNTENEQTPVQFTMTVYDKQDNPIKTTQFNTTIPIERNHLTTIVGNVLTSATEITVTIDDNFANADNPTDAPYYQVAVENGFEFVNAYYSGLKMFALNDITVRAKDVADYNATRSGDVINPSIDLTGYTLTFVTDSEKPLLEVPEGGSFTITDSEGTGEVIVEGTGTAIENKGTVNLNIDDAKVADNAIKTTESGFMGSIVYTRDELKTALETASNETANKFTLGADIEGNVTVVQQPNVKITIDGDNHKFNGYIRVHSNSNHQPTAAVTFKNINFETAKVLYNKDNEPCFNFIEAIDNGNSERYSTNITAENCTFTATGEAKDKAVAVGLQIKSSKWAKAINCTANGLHSLVQAQSCDTTVDVIGCIINDGKNGVAFKQVKEAKVEGTTIVAREYGIRFDGNTDNYGIVVKNNNITAAQPFIVRKMTGKNNTIALEGQNTLTSTREVYQIVITNGSDDAEYVKPTGTYTLTGADGFIVYPDTVVVVDGLLKKENTYLVTNANGLVALSGMTIKGYEIVTLGADIDLTGVEFNGLNAFNPETPNTFDGQGHTVSNWTNNSGASDMGFIRNWVGPIKNVKFEKCHLKTSGRSAIAAAKVYGNIENVTINNCSIEDSYWACGIIAGLYNSGSISNCTVTNSSVKSNGGTAAIVGVFNESAGERGLKNCSVSNTTINNTGAYGEAYSGGALVGMFNSGATFTIEGCTVSNNTLVGGYVYEKYPADESVTIIEK